MLRRLALTLLPLALLAAACTAGGDADGGAQREATKPPTAVRDADLKADDGDAVDALFTTLNPFDLLGSIDGQPDLAAFSQDVDPSLLKALLDADDLPAEFQPMGEFTFSLPGEFGAMELAASQFASGEPMGGDFNATVLSAVVALPAEAADELGDLSELDELTETDLNELRAQTGQLGFQFSDVRVLDASGLGDGGFGVHMEMDFGGLLEAFGAPEGDGSVPSGIAMDIYLFLRGERMLMVMVMWPGGEPPHVDGRALAEAMDEKAAAAF